MSDAPDTMTVRDDEVAVFPLNTVLYPGGPLSLRIFEPRYVDMVSDCLRNERRFAVCLIREGQEAGTPASPHPVGSLARIADWDPLDDGLLGITAHGEDRVCLHDTRISDSGLVIATYDTLAEEPRASVPERHSVLSDLASGLVERAEALYARLPHHLDDATWVGYRLAEMLPLPLARKQHLLEVEDAVARLDELGEVVRAIAEREP